MARFKKFPLSILFIIGLSQPAYPQAKNIHNHDHHHDQQHESQQVGLKLNNGKKWETDAIVRKGMEAIQQEFAKNFKDIKASKASSAVYQQLSDTAIKEMNHIVKNCKLSKDADAQFHFIVGEILSSAGKMKAGKDVASQRQGALDLIKGLNHYEKYFEHSGWKSLK